MNDKTGKPPQDPNQPEAYKPIPLAKPLNGQTTGCVIGDQPWLQDQLKLIGYTAVIGLADLETSLSTHPHTIVACDGVYKMLTAEADGTVSLADAPGIDLMLQPPMLERISSKD